MELELNGVSIYENLILILVIFMLIDFASFTDKGERNVNEDHINISSNADKHIFVLADGLGGHGKGDVASRFVAEKIISLITDENNNLEDCFLIAQKELVKEQKKCSTTYEMKTTAVVLYIDDNKISYGHIGDSRLYFIRKGKIVSRTIDHSVPQMLAISGEIKEKDIRHHEDRNRLLRAMGTEWDEENPKCQIDMQGLEVKKGMSFLLCSDGFWEWITEKEMQRILKKRLSAEEQLQEMLATVLKNGRGNNMDNYSAILVKIKEN